MWGEQVDANSVDGTKVLLFALIFPVRVWPRACANGERLWSDRSITDEDKATPRLGTQRYEFNINSYLRLDAACFVEELKQAQFILTGVKLAVLSINP